MPGERVTILHLSDLQFGQNHRFAGIDLTGLPNHYDTLLERLWDDLQRLRENHDVQPDLVVVTGDLAEEGMKNEFVSAREFLEKLTDTAHLGLPRQRVAIVPGNHDVNRKACKAYFLQCEADGEKPAPPWWPKWQHYAKMFCEFYRDLPSVAFDQGQPWTLFEVPDLQVIIAGLNSTMVEGHDCETPDLGPPRHVGSVGEDQLRWFEEKLKGREDEGWLRIGAVHHNWQRGCKDDEENLEDALDLKKILGPHLNLLLHGHTHEGDLSWLKQHVPIVCTGSAALKEEARPREIPNQYQVLQISARELRRFGRAFLPDLKSFGLDARVGEDQGLAVNEIPFARVSGAFPSALNQDQPDSQPQPRGRIWDDSIDRSERDMADDFLARVAVVCKLRRPDADVTSVRQSGQQPSYIRVVERSDTIARPYPLGVSEDGLTREQLDSFVTTVDGLYRGGDSGLISEIVYGGERPSEEVIREAERRRIRLHSFVEYQGLIDFRPYVEKQTARLENDEIYPPSIYVPQRMLFHIGQDQGDTEDALAQAQEWLVQPDARFVLILGDFGTGKTFLLHELARRMGQDGTGLTPMFVDLRALEKARTLDVLIAQHLARFGDDHIDLKAFRDMLQLGRIVLLFDGFDELALRVSYDRAAEYFDTLAQAVAGQAKVVVTSRTQHFESDEQVRTVLYKRAQPLPGLCYCKLQPFTQKQIYQFLCNKWRDNPDPEAEAKHWLELLQGVKDLLGLSENPRMLGFITELKKEDLATAKQKAGGISAANLYHMLLERWLVFEYERAYPGDAQIILTREARRAAVSAVALRLWEKTERLVSQDEIAEVTSSAVAKVMTAAPPADIVGHLIGAGSLLRRDDEGCFFFVHQSVMEWLVAYQAAEQLKLSRSSALLDVRKMSPLMVEFLCDLAEKEAAIAWARKVAAATGARVAKSNALEVLKRFKVEATLSLAGQDLRGKDFGTQSLVGADLSGADLTEARLARKDLTSATLENAKLIRADLTKSVLAKARLAHANFSEARMAGVNLLGADLTGAVLRRAVLVGAQVDQSILTGVDTFGAAQPVDALAVPCLGRAAECSSVAWHPNLGLLGTGHADGTVRLWEVESGKELRQFHGHDPSVHSVALSGDGDRRKSVPVLAVYRSVHSVSFSRDGRWLASGADDGTVQLWELASGKKLRQFNGHDRSVHSVAFSGDGEWLASGSDDCTVRLWAVASGKELRQFNGHGRGVHGVAFSGDGKWLASGGADGTAMLWEAATGRVLRQFRGHAGSFLSVALSGDGKLLAAGGGDRMVWLWDTATGKELRQFKGHNEWIRSVVFSGNGTRLASGSADGTVRLWDVASGKELRQFSGRGGWVQSVAFSGDDRCLASGNGNGTVPLWEVESGRELRQFKGYSHVIESVTFSANGKWLASGGDDRAVRLWEIATGKELRQFKGHGHVISSVVISGDGRWLASASQDRTVRLWEVESGKELRQFKGHAGWVRCIAFSADGEVLAGGSDEVDRTVRLWEVKSGRELQQFRGHDREVDSVAFSGDGKWLASGSGDSTVRLWEVESGKELVQFKGHAYMVHSVAFSADGKWIASGGHDCTVRLWETGSGKELRQFKGHDHVVNSVVFSPDGKSLASGSVDRTVRLWDADTGRELREFNGHDRKVNSVAFSGDGKWLASGSDDGTLRLWKVTSGQCVAVLAPLPEGWAAFTPDGRYRVGGNVSGHFWHAMALCRFEVGELDEFIPRLRLDPDEPLSPSD